MSQRPSFPKAFYLALLATVLFAMGLTMLLPIMPLFITDELGASERWVGTATLSVAFAAVALRIPAGALLDRHGRRKVMMIGGGFSVIAAGLYLVSQTLAVFLVARLMTGLGLSIFTTAGKALAADLAPSARRGEAMGMYNAAFSIATVVSPLIGEGLKNAAGFQAVFVLNGLLAFAALALAYALPRTIPERNTPFNASGDVKATLYERGMWAGILVMIGMGTILAVMYTFYPLMAERKDLYANAPGLLSSIAIGFGLSIWSLIDTVIEPTAGWLSDRFGRQPIAVPGLVITALGLFALSRAHDTISAYLAIAVLSAGWGMTRAMADSISQDVLSPILRGMGAAVLYACFDLAVGLNAQILSSLIDGKDFGAFFAAALAVVLVSGIAGVLLFTRVRTYEQRRETIPAAAD